MKWILRAPVALCRAMLVALGLVAGCGLAEEARLEEGRALAAQFGMQLKSTLQSAMANGGPVSGPLADVLRTSYPNDQATDYALDDLRGAFSIAWQK